MKNLEQTFDSAFDFGRKVLYKYFKECNIDNVSISKISNLCYYVQAWMQVYYGDLIFNEVPLSTLTGVRYSSIENSFDLIKNTSPQSINDALTESGFENKHKCSLFSILQTYSFMDDHTLACIVTNEPPWIQSKIVDVFTAHPNPFEIGVIRFKDMYEYFKMKPNIKYNTSSGISLN